MDHGSTVHNLLVHRRAQHSRSLPCLRPSLHRRNLHCYRLLTCRGYTYSRYLLVLDKSETTTAYTQLLQGLAPPLCVVLDGGQGVLSAITSCWPTTRIQRCLVHTQRVVRRYTTSRPRTPAGRTLYALALQPTQITTTKQAAVWVVNLHEFGQAYTSFLNEKIPLPKERRTATRTWEYIHVTVRKAYNCLVNLTRQGFLFTYLEPPHVRPLTRSGHP